MSDSVPPEIIDLARQIASEHSLEPALVCAVIEQESAWNPWAVRYEPGFLSRYVAPLYTAGKLSATEAYTRAMSWGLMQVMGQVARVNSALKNPPSPNSASPPPESNSAAASSPPASPEQKATSQPRSSPGTAAPAPTIQPKS